MWGSRVKDGLFIVFKNRDEFTGGRGAPPPSPGQRGCRGGGMRYSNLSNNMMISKL